MPKGPVQYLIIGGGFLAIVFLLWFFFGPTWGPTRKTAAEWREDMKSTSPEVRAAAADQLGHLRDFDAMPLLLAAMDDEDVEVRGRAGTAVGKILGVDFYFRRRPADRAPPGQGPHCAALGGLAKEGRAFTTSRGRATIEMTNVECPNVE